MNHEIVNQVYETTDYSIFKVQRGNRPINNLHKKRLMMSMSEVHLQSPIIVNESMEVIDGQHRLQSQQELGLPVFYIINKGYGLEETHRLNSNSSDWKTTDFMEAYAMDGYRDYIKYKEFYKTYGFGHQDCLNMLSGTQKSTRHYDLFKRGKFRVSNYSNAVDCAEKIIMVGKFYDGFKRRGFVQTMLKAFEMPNYNHARLLQKLKYKSTELVDCTNHKQYSLLVEDIYNYRTKDSERIRLI